MRVAAAGALIAASVFACGCGGSPPPVPAVPAERAPVIAPRAADVPAESAPAETPRAADVPAENTPAVAPRDADVAWERRVDGLFSSMPEPSADRAFTFDGEIEFGVPERGSFHLDVRAGEFEGRPAWRVVQDESHPKFPNGQPAGAEHTQTWLSRDLRVLGGEVTIVSDDVVRKTPIQPSRTLPLAAALIYFRACPAQVTALADPVAYPVVDRVERDGGLACSADTSDAYRVFITLRGRDRVAVEVKRFLGWHDMGTIVAR